MSDLMDENLLSIFDEINDYVFILNEAGSTQHINASCKKDLEYLADNILGGSFFDLFPPEYKPGLIILFSQIKSSPQIKFKYPILKKNGERLNVETTIRSSVIDNKSILICVCKKIDDLIYDKRKYEFLFNSNTTPTSISSFSKGIYSDVNDAFCEFTGYSREEVIGRNSIDIGILRNPESRMSLYSSIIGEKKAILDDLQITLKSGETRTCTLNAELIEFENNKFLVMNLIEPVGNATPINLEYRNERKDIYSDFKSNEFKAVFDSFDSIIYFSDINTYELLFVNKAGRELFGDFVGKKCYEYLQNGEMSTCPFCTNDKILDAAGTPTGVYNWEFTNTRNQKHYRCSDNAIQWPDGRMVRMEIAVDITNVKSAEVELNKTQDLHLSVVNNLTEVIFQTDENGLWIFLNPAWEAITGFSVKSSIGELFLNYVHPDDRERNAQLFQPLINREKEYCKHVIRYLTADGGFKWIEVYAKLSFNETGEIIGTTGTLSDVHDRINAENALKANQANLKAILENIPYMAWLKDNTGKFVSVNSQFADSLDLTLEEVIGKTDYDFCDANTADAFTTKDAEVMQTGSRIFIEEPAWVDGVERWTETFKTPVLDESGNVIGTTGLSRDITERKQTEALLKTRLEFIEFVSDLSSGLINIDLDEIDAAIHTALEFVTNYTVAERGCVYFITHDKTKLKLVSEWRPGNQIKIKSLIEYLIVDKIPYLSLLKTGEIVTTRINDLPDEMKNSRLQSVLNSLQINNLIQIPLIVANDFIGFIGFSSTDVDREWSKDTINAYTLTGQIIANTMARKRVAEELNEQKHLLDNIINTAPIGIWLAAENGSYPIMNKYFEESVAWNRPNFSITPDEYDRSIETDMLARSMNVPYVNEEVLTFVDGKKHILQTLKTKIEDENGNPIGVLGVGLDITDRKAMEEKLKSINVLHSLVSELSSKLIKANVDYVDQAIDEALKILGEYGRIDNVYVFDFNYENNTMDNIYEWRSDSAPSEIERLQGVPNSIIPRWFEKFNKNEHVYIPDVNNISEEFLVEKEILASRSVLTSLTVPMFYSDKLIGFIGFDSILRYREWSDEQIALLRLAGEILAGTITRKKFEDEILLAKKSAESANRAKSEFLANMSHEIRTPMNAILGFSEILLNKIDNPQHKNYVSTILSGGRTLLSLINDILDLSKIEAGKMEIVTEPVDIAGILKDVYNIFSQKIDEKGLGFALEIDEQLPKFLMLDEVRFRQVLFNLIGNAVKFTDKGLISVKVSFTNMRSECENVDSFNDIFKRYLDLVIEVSDTGVGIPEDKFEVIFEAFRQVSATTSRKFGGTGLGLAITHRLCQIMNGDIKIKSEVDKGSSFYIYLNKIEIVKEVLGAENSFIWRDDAILFNASKLLVVDDIAQNRELVSVYLENKNITIFEAISGEESIQLASVLRPDLILMDLRMPGMSGYEAAKMIKENTVTAHIPIIAFTASTMKNEDAYIRSKFDGYLRKPVNQSELLNELMKFLCFTEIDNSLEIFDELNREVINTEVVDEGCSEQLIAILKRDFIHKTTEILDCMVFDEMQEFSENIKILLNEYHSSQLSEFSRKLSGNIDNFDFDEVEKKLKDFPEFVESLNKKHDS